MGAFIDVKVKEYKANLILNIPPSCVGESLRIPFRCGVPVPKGRIAEPLTASVSGEGLCDCGCHVETLATWPDGSSRWVAVEGVLSLSRAEQTRQVVSIALRPTPEKRLRVGERAQLSRENGSIIQVDSGRLLIGRPHLRVSASIYIKDATTRRIPLEITGCEPGNSGGPVEKVVVRGRFKTKRHVTFIAHIAHYVPAHATLIAFTLRNSWRARHRGGLWDLGDPGSVLLGEFGLDIELPAVIRTWRWADGSHCSSVDSIPIQDYDSHDSDEFGERWSIFQASSGGENWHSVNHIDARGLVRLPFRGYVLRFGKEERRGDRIFPLCVAETDHGPIALTVPRFWEEFPKRIAVSKRSIQIGLLAGYEGQIHELQGGEQKTFKVWIIQPDGELRETGVLIRQLAAVCFSSVILEQIPPDVPEILAPLPRRDEWTGSRLAEFAEKAAFGQTGILANREKIDEYGWRHFGDTYADHEETYYQGRLPLVSHYNNQFDLLYGCILQRLISGDPRWDEIIVPLANHIIDIDIYHTDQDRSTFNHGLFWMTDHYRTAYTATHRAFSRYNAQSKGYGGGPCNEHNYTSGLTLYYFLWGDDRAKEAVLELANWVIAMEDGSQTPYCILDNGPTGLATMTSSHDYHGPGRGAANSINALLDAWLLTDEKRYLEFAELLIKRTIHPEDNIEALDLLNAELRWSYTMYLEVLAKYLRIKCLFEQNDLMREYVKYSLVKYAQWMLANEKPYLARAEELQYPTEAWAAQDFRKATVLLCACQHVSQEAAARFREKAVLLAEAAWRDLLRFPRPYNVRAAAVILTQGIWHLALSKLCSETCSPSGNHHDWPLWPREKFIPQRDRVESKLKTPQGWLTLLVRISNPRVLARLLRVLWRWRN